jgi:hypothetical protein
MTRPMRYASILSAETHVDAARRSNKWGSR